MPALLPSVTAIIVNYKSATHALRCIATLLSQQDVALEILVVDNASGDGSVETIGNAYPEQVALIASAENLGFGKANNLAARQAQGEYLLIINPDIELLATDVVAGLVQYLQQTPQAGVVGPDVLESRRGKRVLPRPAYPLQNRLRHTPGLDGLPGKHAWILGACMLFRKNLYDRIGGFDEHFFLYGEDIDICLRIRQAGYEVAWQPAFKAEHWAGASESGERVYDVRSRKRRGYYQFCLKHYASQDIQRLLKAVRRKAQYNLLALRVRQWLGFNRTSPDLRARMDRNRAELDVVGRLLDKSL